MTLLANFGEEVSAKRVSAGARTDRPQIDHADHRHAGLLHAGPADHPGRACRLQHHRNSSDSEAGTAQQGRAEMSRVFGVCALMAVSVLAGCADLMDMVARRPSPPSVNAPVAGAITPANQADLYLDVIDGVDKTRPRRCGTGLSGCVSRPEARTDIPLLVAERRCDAGPSPLSRGVWRLCKAGHDAARSPRLERQGTHRCRKRPVAGCGGQIRQGGMGRTVHPDLLNNLAYAQLRLGQSAASALRLRQAHELDPNSALVRNNLIAALTLTGDRVAAERLLEDVKAGPEREHVRAVVQAMLANMRLAREGKP